MVIKAHKTQRADSLAVRPPTRSRAGTLIRVTLVCFGLFIGWGVGFSIGRLSTFARSSPSSSTGASVPVWQYRLPKISEKVDPSYRSMLEETGAGVDAVMKAHPANANAISALAIYHYLAHDSAG